MPVTEIQAGKNGPYRMQGGLVTMVDSEGNETVVERPRISLCRCGFSQTKPLCDGSHRTCGFQAPEVTLQWDQEQEELVATRA